ncbi:MAG: type II secretion system F family protein [Micrococcus sp.]|nr:type II secretion system F family protein [Micrococcus sp.]
MTATVALGAMLGLVFAGGVLLILRYIPLGWKPSLEQRIAPQMRHHRPPSALLFEDAVTTPWSAFGRIADPLVTLGVRSLAKYRPGTDGLQQRLDAAGSTLTISDYRAQQVMLAVAGAVVSVVAAVALVNAGTVNPFFAAVLVMLLTSLSALARDSLLTSSVKARRRRMLTEFPSIAELFALSISAGESTTGALERIATMARGDLAFEFTRTLREMRAGASLAHALRDCSQRIQLPPVTRFVDGVLVAIERGTPLADVVRAQAQDVREMSKRELMESAGRKEIQMMFPLVFGILPLTVVFAVFPGITLMNVGF